MTLTSAALPALARAYRLACARFRKTGSITWASEKARLRADIADAKGIPAPADLDRSLVGARVRFMDGDIVRTGTYAGRGFWREHVVWVPGFVGPLTTTGDVVRA